MFLPVNLKILFIVQLYHNHKHQHLPFPVISNPLHTKSHFLLSIRLVKMLRFIGCSVNSNKNRKRKADGDEPETPHVIEYIATLRLPKKESAGNGDTPKTKKTKTEKTPKTPKTPKTGAKKTAKEGTPGTPQKKKETNGTPSPVHNKKIKTEHPTEDLYEFLY